MCPRFRELMVTRPTLNDLPSRPERASDVLDLLVPLNSRARALKRQHLDRYRKPWETRVRMAGGFEAAIGVAQMLVNIRRVAESGQLLAPMTGRPDQLASVDFTLLTGLTPDSDVAFAKEMYKISARLGLVLTAQFQVERMMIDLLRALGHPSGAFEPNARALLQHAAVPSPLRKATWMYLPSLIRNTLHSGGFHDRRNRRITIGNTTYTFERGRRFEQAGWHHIVHALSAEFDVIEELLAAPLLRNLGRVPDRYAFVELVGYPPRKAVYPIT